MLSTNTQQSAPLIVLAILFISSMSQTFKVGFEGVSIQISFVSGVIASLTFYKSVRSMKSIFIPNLATANFRMYLFVPPYTSSQQTTWSPVLRQ